MQSLGTYLRELRTTRGLSLEELARTTRVGQNHLRALESDAFDELPAPVFAKGFIRAYCLALGVPPDEALSRYHELAVPALSRAAPPPAFRPEATGRWPVLVSFILLIVLGLALFLLNVVREGRAPRPAPGGRAGVSVRAEGTAGVPASPVKAPPPKGAPSRLVARTTEPTWVRVETDDGKVVQELLPAGARREWVSGKRFILTIGNAGGITLELNGEPIPPLGARGAVIQRLVLPPERPAP